MGVRLIVEVLDHGPKDAAAAERLLLVALAEKADDVTRKVIWSRGENPRETLRARLGVTDSGLTKVFARLARLGDDGEFDPRVAIGTDRSGRPVYAYEGSAVEYVIPQLRACPAGESPVDNSPESLPDQGPTHQVEPAQPGTHEGTTGEALEPERLPDRAGHIPLSLDGPSIDAREGAGIAEVPAEQRVAVLELIGRHGAALAEVDAVDCAAWVSRVISPANLAGYLSRFSVEDIRTRAEQERDETATSTPDTRKCPHGTINGRQILGRGANASRRCDRCEQARPAESEVLAPPRSRRGNDIDWEAAAARAAARDAATGAAAATERAS